MNRKSKTREKGLKGFLFWWLENKNNPKQFIVEAIIFIAIIASVTLTILELLFQEINLPWWVFQANNILTIIFVIEYIIRFYISTDFISDVRDKGVLYAIVNKFRWVLSPSALLDLIALFPIIRFFRIFRTLRILRLVKLFRFLRILKLKKLVESVSLFVRSFKDSYSFFIILLILTLIVIMVNSVGLFLAESQVNESETLGKNILYTLKQIGLVDIKPKTILGKIFATLTLLANMAFIGFCISIITSRMGEIMDNIKKGKYSKLTVEDHIILCGLSNSTKKVIEELSINKKYDSKKIILVTEKENPDINGVVYVNGDFSDIDVLNKVNIKKAILVVVFAESNKNETVKNIDMRTIMTVYNIEQENPNIHTIAEIINEKNAEIIKNRIKGDEIIFKETIDAHLIVNCIRHPSISPMVYDLLDLKGRNLKEKTLEKLNPKYKSGITFGELKKDYIENDMLIIGYIYTDDEGTKSKLAPMNNAFIKPEDRLIYIQ